MRCKETVYDTLCTTVDALCTAYAGGGIRQEVFGTSYLGRPIPAIRLGEGSHRLLYLAGMTGSVCSAALLLHFVRDYAAAVESGGRIAGIDISYLEHTRSITVVPLLNVDGVVLRCEGADDKNPLLSRLLAMREAQSSEGDARTEAFAGWVCNGRGVDLRCNFDADFALAVAASSGIGGAGFPGMFPESEPECAAVTRYLRAASVTDLVLLLSDGRDEGCGGGIRYCGSDHRTRNLAQILARDIDGRGYESTSAELRHGTLGAWYRTQNTGALLNVTVPDPCEGGGPEAEEAYLHALRDSAASVPGDALAGAVVALQYGKLRKMLFHGAVL